MRFRRLSEGLLTGRDLDPAQWFPWRTREYSARREMRPSTVLRDLRHRVHLADPFIREDLLMSFQKWCLVLFLE